MKKTIYNAMWEEILSAVKSDENISIVLEIMQTLSNDPIYTQQVFDLLNNKQPETRAFIAYLAKELQPKKYLEVGVRRGWSLATVAKMSPECKLYGFDAWHMNYGGVENPGPEFVLSELKKLGCNNDVVFVDGNSHETLPKFFKENQNLQFDMILIDGDHSVDGATQDLLDAMPHIAVGGVIVFDDIVLCHRLDEVWYSMEQYFPNFKYFTYTGNTPGVGFGIRIK